ncbi:hypothetical protein [Polynucleobacter sphagniphilus]|uniref:hypothetical protein n=1 Tax=Polynucleobacter sphagniphilus TaxID=1743169 RepID=UPI0024051485|nr:hypothetical protein [Polynucleobacter sphagniphilus]MDF9788108.1 hypothetical protein [Polynucleobacter sphagniphilus]
MGDIEFFAKLNPQRLTSLEEDHKAEQKQILADQEHWAKHGTNRPRRGSPSKTELMEQLSRERFPEDDF